MSGVLFSLFYIDVHSDGLMMMHYLTEPTIPATKCFCIMKNTMAVGNVAMTMAVMMTP